MRADRLISLIMLLQTRGKSSARQLAGLLEVSDRTIYRDIVALSGMGIPVYGEAGPQGGYALVDSFRTSLTGLTEGEVQALFMLNIPEPLQVLGVGPQLKGAFLKLAAALPEWRRREQERVRQRLHLDATWWQQVEEYQPALQTIHQAVWQDLKLQIRYRVWAGRSEVERLVEPYGLVAKAGVWYLVCAWQGKIRVKRLSNLLEVRLTDESFERPADFDLADFWNGWRAKEEQRFKGFQVKVRIAPQAIPALVHEMGNTILDRLALAGPAEENGWNLLELSFESHYEARNRLMAFGSGLEVLEPPALRFSILDLADQISGLYRSAIGPSSTVLDEANG